MVKSFLASESQSHINLIKCLMTYGRHLDLSVYEFLLTNYNNTKNNWNFVRNDVSYAPTQWYYKFQTSITPETQLLHGISNESSLEGPRATVSRYQCLPLFLRPRSPPSTRPSQWQSVRDWSTHSSTKFPHWSDKTFHGVEEECWLTPFNGNCTGSRMYSLWRHWSSRNVVQELATMNNENRLQGLFSRRGCYSFLFLFFFGGPPFRPFSKDFPSSIRTNAATRPFFFEFLGQVKLVCHGNGTNPTIDLPIPCFPAFVW